MEGRDFLKQCGWHPQKHEELSWEGRLDISMYSNMLGAKNGTKVWGKRMSVVLKKINFLTIRGEH